MTAFITCESACKVSFTPEGGPESRIQVQVIYLGGLRSTGWGV